MKSKMKLKPLRLKPNGKPEGTFVISIDDGYVEYAYNVSLKTRNASISKAYRRIRKLFRSIEDEGQMRTRHYILK